MQATPFIIEQFTSRPAVRYEKGERVIRAHDDPQEVYYVAKGVVRLYMLSREGDEFTAMLYSKGDMFPLRWLYKDLRNIYNFQAITDVEVHRMPKADFKKIVLTNQEAVEHVLSQVMRDRLALIRRLRSTIFGNATQRVANSLLTISQQFEEFQSSDEIPEVVLTHQQIADLSGITRETTSVELKKMEHQGIIAYRGRTILLVNLPELREMAEL